VIDLKRVVISIANIPAILRRVRWRNVARKGIHAGNYAEMRNSGENVPKRS
jgi:hypothetical protein